MPFSVAGLIITWSKS